MTRRDQSRNTRWSGVRPALDRQLRLLEAAVRRQFPDEEDVVASLTLDQQGIGSGPDVSTIDESVREADLMAGPVGT
ncbi:MAG: hypothetical protein H0U89_07200 [Acidimicrobiia bacterium]|nr:hypothetical protein [Acidimicrobiia bacterium]